MIIKRITCNKILNSAGDVTVEARVITRGASGVGSSGSGTSESSYAAQNYNKPLNKVIKEINTGINNELRGREVNNVNDILALEKLILKRDLGSLGTLSVSYALLDALSKETDKPKHALISKRAVTKPFLVSKIIGGGLHAGNTNKIQEFLVCPRTKKPLLSAEISNQVMKLVREDLRKRVFGRDLEGGLVINASHVACLKSLRKAVSQVQDEYNTRVLVGLDVAANSFYKNGFYHFNTRLSQEEYYDEIKRLIEEFELFYVEDAFHETRNEWFRKLLNETKKVLVVSDDLTATQPSRIKELKDCFNAVIIKPNQAGGLSKTLEAVKLAKKLKKEIIISHRSRETNDTTITHLAVSANAGFMKISVNGGERVCKVNELIKLIKG